GVGTEMVVLAEIVILAAGSLGSTEILLRSRAAGLHTSDRLGEAFTGNADVLACGYNTDHRINGIGIGTRDPKAHPSVGPTITCAIDGRTSERSLAEQFMIQDAVLPGALDAIYPSTLGTAAAACGTDTDEGVLDALAERRRILRSRLPGGAFTGAVANTQPYLGMGLDSCTGKLHPD